MTDVTEDGDRATLQYRSPIAEIPTEVELERSGQDWRISKLNENV